jgi:peroxiredoxin
MSGQDDARREARRSRLNEGKSMVDVGDMAPDFTLRGASGNELALSALRGSKRALLMFYPEDLTSG